MDFPSIIPDRLTITDEAKRFFNTTTTEEEWKKNRPEIEERTNAFTGDPIYYRIKELDHDTVELSAHSGFDVVEGIKLSRNIEKSTFQNDFGYIMAGFMRTLEETQRLVNRAIGKRAYRPWSNF